VNDYEIDANRLYGTSQARFESGSVGGFVPRWGLPRMQGLL